MNAAALRVLLLAPDRTAAQVIMHLAPELEAIHTHLELSPHGRIAIRGHDVIHIVCAPGWPWLRRALACLLIKLVRPVRLVLHLPPAARQLDRLSAFVLRQADGVLVSAPRQSRECGMAGIATRFLPATLPLPMRARRPASKPTAPTILLAGLGDHPAAIAAAMAACAFLARARPGASFLLVARPEHHGALEAAADAHGIRDIVHLATHTQQAGLAELCSCAHVLLDLAGGDMPGNEVLTAATIGVPVVSVSHGAVEHGVSGLVVPVDSPRAIGAALLRLLDDPPLTEHLCQGGRAVARAHTPAAIAARLQGFYQHAVRSRRKGLYARLVSGVLFPLHEWCKRHDTVRVRKRLEQSQWWSLQQIEQYQHRGLHTLLTHAGAHVPYYRELFARLGVQPGQLGTAQLLSQLPLLTKDLLRAGANAFTSEVAAPLTRSNTGGSSGEPLIFHLSKERKSHDIAAKWRATRWWQVDIGQAEVVLWGSPIELSAQDHVRALRDRLLCTSLLPAFDLTTSTMDGFLRQLRQRRPAMLVGYPSALALLARHAKARRVRLDDIGIQVVFVTAERLYDDQRKMLEEVMQCPVANGYGGRDSGFIAHECPEGGMHVAAEDILVEIVDQAGRPVPEGQSGQIVVTHLATRDYPFIRYATGDIGRLSRSPCPCGRSLPLLKQLDGRSTDFVQTQDGQVMHGLALIYILRDVPQIRTFKIIQESLSLTRLLIVALPALDAPVKQRIAGEVKARLGPDVTVHIDEVDHIPVEASGKFRYVVSNVANPLETR